MEVQVEDMLAAAPTDIGQNTIAALAETGRLSDLPAGEQELGREIRVG